MREARREDFDVSKEDTRESTRPRAEQCVHVADTEPHHVGKGWEYIGQPKT